MFKNLTSAAATAILAVGLAAGSVRAQEPAIAPEKRALIQELLAVTNAKKNAAATMRAISAQAEQDLPRMMVQMVATDPDLKLTAQQRKDALKIAEESAASGFRRFQTLFAQQVDVGRLVEDLSYPVYDRFFTAGEIKDLIAFYKTPTGKKTLEVTPQLMAETMARTNERLIPVMQQIYRQIVAEEKTELKKRLAMAPSKPPSAPKK